MNAFGANTTELATIHLMSALDALEAAQGEGARSADLDMAAFEIEARIMASRTTDPAALLWGVRRLARAVENEWSEESTMPLMRWLEAGVLALAEA